MIPVISLCLLCFHICCSLTVTLDNFAEIQLQQKGRDVWRLSCRVTNSPPKSLPVRMSIFKDTPNITLVAIYVNQCPKVEDSAQAKHIYLHPCVEHEKSTSLDILLLNYNPVENKKFGCNYTQVLEGGIISHSLAFAKVNIGNASQKTSNGTNCTNNPAIYNGTDVGFKEKDIQQDPLLYALITICLLAVALVISVYRLCSGYPNARHSLSQKDRTYTDIATDQGRHYEVIAGSLSMPDNVDNLHHDYIEPISGHSSGCPSLNMGYCKALQDTP